MCYDLIAAHKVESMCAAQRTGMRHLEHSSGSTGEQALNISHISHQGISGSHQASLCLWIIWSILEGWVSFGGERIFEGTGSKSTSGSCSKAKQEEAANISHISQQGISGCHQASPCLCLANLEHLQPGRRGLTGRNFISACTSMRLCTRGGGSYQQPTINYFDGTHPAEI